MSRLGSRGIYPASDAAADGVTGGATSLCVLLLDKSQLFSEVLRQWLLREPDVDVVGIAGTVSEALGLLADGPFDLVVATPMLARELLSCQSPTDVLVSSTSVVVIAGAGDREHARELFGLGVVGWVGPGRSSADLLAVMQTSRHGTVCVPADVLAGLTRDHALGPVSSPRDRVLSALTDREMDVFVLLEQGMSRVDIASTLHLSSNTVRTHIGRILRRLNVHSTLAALALARVAERSTA